MNDKTLIPYYQVDTITFLYISMGIQVQRNETQLQCLNTRRYISRKIQSYVYTYVTLIGMQRGENILQYMKCIKNSQTKKHRLKIVSVLLHYVLFTSYLRTFFLRPDYLSQSIRGGSLVFFPKK